VPYWKFLHYYSSRITNGSGTLLSTDVPSLAFLKQ
jgi:hypothetical protein